MLLPLGGRNDGGIEAVDGIDIVAQVLINPRALQMPLTSPLPRYYFMPWSVAGRAVR